MVFAVGYSHQAIRAGRARVLTALAFAAIGACWMKLFTLQVIRGKSLALASDNNSTQRLVERAPRGRILDRHGAVLADDQPVFVALFSPLGLDSQLFESLADRMSALLDVQGPEIQKRIFAAVKSKSMVRISDRLTRAQAFQILQSRTHLPGISLTIEEQRHYPMGKLASHVLGHVGQITDAELEHFAERGYQSGDWIGKLGLERLYDPTLHGQDGGFVIEVDARGRQVRVIRHVPPEAGKDIVLTLDHKLQALAEQKLSATRHAGAAVVINPNSGELLALASSPGFDPNLFMPLGDSKERKELLQDPKLPLFNRTILGLYPPGSTFKIISSLAALEKRTIDPSRRVFCSGSYVYGKENRVFKCWKKEGHGYMNFTRALAESCDVYYYQLGMDVGAEAIEEMAVNFGLGATTGVDLPHEKKAKLPLALKRDRKRASDRFWAGGETLNYAIGQGLLQVTPLQMAMLMSTFASGGAIWQPYLVADAQHFGKLIEHLGQPKLLKRLTLSERSMALVREGLEQVVKSGTGGAAQIPGIRVAGKTGTAQAAKGEDHAWFVAYAPVENPQVACAVLVEHGGHGGSAAAPIAHDLLAMVLKSDEVGQVKIQGVLGD